MALGGTAVAVGDGLAVGVREGRGVVGAAVGEGGDVAVAVAEGAAEGVGDGSAEPAAAAGRVGVGCSARSSASICSRMVRSSGSKTGPLRSAW